MSHPTPDAAPPAGGAPDATPDPAATADRPVRRVLLAALLAAVVAAPLNAVAATVAVRLGAEADGPLMPRAYLVLTVLGALGGTVGWHVVRRRSPDAARTLRRLVPAVLAASLLPVAGMTAVRGWPVGVALALMHVLTAAVAVPTFLRLLPLRARPPSAPR